MTTSPKQQDIYELIAQTLEPVDKSIEKAFSASEPIVWPAKIDWNKSKNPMLEVSQSNVTSKDLVIVSEEGIQAFEYTYTEDTGVTDGPVNIMKDSLAWSFESSRVGTLEAVFIGKAERLIVHRFKVQGYFMSENKNPSTIFIYDNVANTTSLDVDHIKISGEMIYNRLIRQTPVAGQPLLTLKEEVYRAALKIVNILYKRQNPY